MVRMLSLMVLLSACSTAPVAPLEASDACRTLAEDMELATVQLNRATDAVGKLCRDPDLVAHLPGADAQPCHRAQRRQERLSVEAAELLRQWHGEHCATHTGA